MSDNIRCQGWWEQAETGRQPMEGLMIQIDGNRISGSGYDMVGAFTFEGTLTEDNDVLMTKQYLGEHALVYRGAYNGADKMWGIWEVWFEQGPWEISFRSASAQKKAEKKEEVASIGF
ncbi:MAG: hypothetical protein AAF206_11580 [Bacteroidota bacterium]